MRCLEYYYTTGNNIKVAVLDQGIDKSHNDLSANISTLSYDAKSGTSSSSFNVGLNHGTHVAGTIAAVKDNNLQVVGVAPSSKIMVVSHDLFISSTISEELADGINWAYQNGADVINNSWGDQGGVFYNQLHSALLDNAISDAMNFGRNGLGTIIVFASGNESPVIDYPANSNPNILTVGAINSNGSRAGFSGFGNELDVVAPGVNILSTTNLQNIDSYNGTSMAAPHVSGVVALVLSANPSLTLSQVNNIIESTSQKVGLYSYTNNVQRPNGTWNNEMGYGLIDANAAVQMAQAMQSEVIGDNIICSGESKTYTLSSGSVNSWQVSSSLQIVSSTNSAITVTPSSSSIRERGFVRAIIGNSQIIEKTMWVGKPDAYTIDTNGIKNYMGGSYYFPVQNGVRGEISVFSDSPRPNFNFTGPSNYGWWQINRNTVEVDLSFSGSYTLNAQITNECGTHYFFVFVNIGGIPPDNFNVSPNPSSTYFTINNNNNDNDSETFQFELYDLNMNRKVKDSFKKNKKVFVSSLKKGIYILRIISKDGIEHHRIIKE